MVYHKHLWRWLLPGKINITSLWKHSQIMINCFSHCIALSDLKQFMSEAHQLNGLLCFVEMYLLSSDTESFFKDKINRFPVVTCRMCKDQDFKMELTLLLTPLKCVHHILSIVAELFISKQSQYKKMFRIKLNEIGIFKGPQFG